MQQVKNLATEVQKNAVVADTRPYQNFPPFNSQAKDLEDVFPLEGLLAYDPSAWVRDNLNLLSQDYISSQQIAPENQKASKIFNKVMPLKLLGQWAKQVAPYIKEESAHATLLCGLIATYLTGKCDVVQSFAAKRFQNELRGPRCLTEIIALALHVFNYSIPMGPLMADLRTKSEVLIKTARGLGLIVEQNQIKLKPNWDPAKAF